MEAGQKTVMFAPMLSVLFIGTRMRALQLTKADNGKVPQGAGPQPWAQAMMYLATEAVLLQLVLVLIMGAMYSVEMDDDGNVLPPKNASPVVGGIVTFIRYAAMIAMYGGVCTIIYAVF